MADVPKPTDFGLQYEDVALDTPDHIKVRAYLLVQRKNIPQATPMDVAGDMSDEEVRYQLHSRLLKPRNAYLLVSSSRRRDRQS